MRINISNRCSAKNVKPGRYDVRGNERPLRFSVHAGDLKISNAVNFGTSTTDWTNNDDGTEDAWMDIVTMSFDRTFHGQRLRLELLNI